MMVQSRRATRLRVFGLGLLTITLLGGCNHPPWPPIDNSGERILDQLNQRAEETVSATYRVRWRAFGTDPHATFFLDIAYQHPDRFRVTADGPFGIPAFTAVIVDETFWFVDHREKKLVTDQLRNLGDYNIPMADFFSGHWRELFSGGWGPGNSRWIQAMAFIPGNRRNEYETGRGPKGWTVNWNHKKSAPRWLRAEIEEEGRIVLIAQTWFDHYRDEYPYWQLKNIRITGFPGGGEHLWKVLHQEYNLKIPDRLFKPLKPPRRR